MVKLSEVASADANKRPIIAETEHLIVQDALKVEIPDIIAMENDPDNSDFIWQGTPEQHADEIDDPAHMLVMIRDKSDYHVVGYSLIHINKQSEIFELRRIAMNEKGKGYGTEILAAYFKLAFESLGINRFWLDVFLTMPRASTFTRKWACTATASSARTTRQSEATSTKSSTPC